jgi:hypothetical protein
MHIQLVKLHLKNLFYRQEGLALVEFAISIFVLLILFMGCVAVTHYAVAIQSIEKIIGKVTHDVVQIYPNQPTTPLTNQSFSNLLSAVMYTTPDMLKMSLASNGSYNGGIILTDVKVTGGVPTVQWQYCYSGGGNTAITSRITSATGGSSSYGTSATLPNTLSEGDEVIAGEILYFYSPIITQDYVASTTLYRMTIATVQPGTFTSIGHNFPTSSCQ